MAASQRPGTPRAGRRRRLATTVIALGLVFLLAGSLLRAERGPSMAGPRAFSIGGGGGGSPPPMNLNLTDAPSFTPSSIAAHPGAALAIHLLNVGSFPHTFTVSSVANLTINRSWSPALLDQFFQKNGSWANVSLAPGASVWSNFTLPESASGSYEFVSLVAYQFQAGMFGFLNVTGGSGSGGVKFTEQTAGASLAFVPAVLAANATSYPLTIDVAVSNLGSTPHTWTVVGQPDVNVTAGDWASYFKTHAPAANVSVPSVPGQVVWANFTVPKAGVYQYICEIPGHLGAGMEGYLYVGISPPAAAAPPSDAIVEPLLLLGGGALLVVGVLLVLAASLVGRIPAPTYGRKH